MLSWRRRGCRLMLTRRVFILDLTMGMRFGIGPGMKRYDGIDELCENCWVSMFIPLRVLGKFAHRCSYLTDLYIPYIPYI